MRTNIQKAVDIVEMIGAGFAALHDNLPPDIKPLYKNACVNLATQISLDVCEIAGLFDGDSVELAKELAKEMASRQEAKEVPIDDETSVLSEEEAFSILLDLIKENKDVLERLKNR